MVIHVYWLDVTCMKIINVASSRTMNLQRTWDIRKVLAVFYLQIQICCWGGWWRSG